MENRQAVRIARDNTKHAWAVDQNAGREINGLQWGKLTVVADGNFWRDFATTGQPLKFMQNIRDDTATRRLLAAVGINPNATGIKYQATALNKEVSEKRSDGERCDLQNRRRVAARRAAISSAGKHLPQ